MIRLKYYNTFSITETELAKVQGDLPDESSFKQKFDKINTADINLDSYDEEKKCFCFEYHDTAGVYKVEIYSQWETILVTFPDYGFVWCAFSAIIKNALYLTSFDPTSKFYPWLLDIAINYSVYEMPTVTYGTNPINRAGIDEH